MFLDSDGVARIGADEYVQVVTRSKVKAGGKIPPAETV
jgi:hypothetical protein